MHPLLLRTFRTLAVAGAILAVVWLASRLLSPTAGRGQQDVPYTAYDPPEPAPGFSLADHTGATRRLEDYRGRAVLLFFGFTHCPDVCPLTLAKLAKVLDAMPASAAGDVAVLLITVDPTRDTPPVLAEYVARFGEQTVGLTGEPQALAELRRAYGAYAGHGAQHQEMVHTDAVFGIDRSGQLRMLLHPELPTAEMVRSVRALLRF